MIQRVQTLFLFGITILSSLLIFIPFKEYREADSSYLLCLMPGCLSTMVKPFIYVPMVLNFVILALSLFTIFKYKNRKQQMKFSQLLMVLSALLIGSLFVMDFIKGSSTTMVADYKIASFFPIINAVLAFLARMFIKKDEELVRSADRIR